MPLTKCFKCKGRGWLRDGAATNPLIVICTLGLSLADRYPCNTCDGTGYLR